MNTHKFEVAAHATTLNDLSQIVQKVGEVSLPKSTFRIGDSLQLGHNSVHNLRSGTSEPSCWYIAGSFPLSLFQSGYVYENIPKLSGNMVPGDRDIFILQSPNPMSNVFELIQYTQPPENNFNQIILKTKWDFDPNSDPYFTTIKAACMQTSIFDLELVKCFIVPVNEDSDYLYFDIFAHPSCLYDVQNQTVSINRYNMRSFKAWTRVLKYVDRGFTLNPEVQEIDVVYRSSRSQHQSYEGEVGSVVVDQGNLAKYLVFQNGVRSVPPEEFVVGEKSLPLFPVPEFGRIFDNLAYDNLERVRKYKGIFDLITNNDEDGIVPRLMTKFQLMLIRGIFTVLSEDFIYQFFEENCKPRFYVNFQHLVPIIQNYIQAASQYKMYSGTTPPEDIERKFVQASRPLQSVSSSSYIHVPFTIEEKYRRYANPSELHELIVNGLVPNPGLNVETLDSQLARHRFRMKLPSETNNPISGWTEYSRKSYDFDPTIPPFQPNEISYDEMSDRQYTSGYSVNPGKRSKIESDETEYDDEIDVQNTPPKGRRFRTFRRFG